MESSREFECDVCEIKYLSPEEAKSCSQSHCMQAMNVPKEEFSIEVDCSKPQWSDSLISVLLDMIQERYHQIKDKTKRRKSVWKEIWLEMRTHVPEATADQIQHKWRNLVASVRKYDSQGSENSKGKMLKPIFYNKVKDILGEDPMPLLETPSEPEPFLTSSISASPDPASPNAKFVIMRERKQPWSDDHMEMFLSLVQERYPQIRDRTNKKKSVWREIWIEMQNHIPDITLEQATHKWRNLNAAVRRYDESLSSSWRGRVLKPLFYDKVKEIIQDTLPVMTPLTPLSAEDISCSVDIQEDIKHSQMTSPSLPSFVVVAGTDSRPGNPLGISGVTGSSTGMSPPRKKAKIILPKTSSKAIEELVKLRREMSSMRKAQETFQKEMQSSQQRVEKETLETLKAIAQAQESRVKTESELVDVLKAIAKSLEEMTKHIQK